MTLLGPFVAPFVGGTVLMVRQDGWIVAAAVWGLTLGICACIVIGVALVAA